MTTTAFDPSTERTSRLYWVALGLLMLVGLYGGLRLLTQGLQVTGLTDQVPWGLWITLDASAIALGAGAFAFSAITYVFRVKRFEPVARLAVYIGFLADTSAMVALAADLGRVDRFWHPLVFWNPSSILWQVTWCVILYSSILAIELLPMAAQGRLGERWPRLIPLAERLHRGMPILAGVGALIALQHQATLGATFGVLNARAIWFEPSLPIMFILSALVSGVSLVLLVFLGLQTLKGQRYLAAGVVDEIARYLGVGLLVYLYLRLWDWASIFFFSTTPGSADALQRLAGATPYAGMVWILEVGLGVLLPAFLLLVPALRRQSGYAFMACAMVVVGLVVNRWNTTMSGLIAPPHWSPGIMGSGTVVSYFPSFVELAVVLGVIGYALAAFSLGIRYLRLISPVED